MLNRRGRKNPVARAAEEPREAGRLDPRTVLVRAPELRVALTAAGLVKIRENTYGNHALAILDAFLRQRSIEDALRLLQSRATGARDWAELIATITALHFTGVLVEPDAPGTRSLQWPQTFDAAPIHVAMLNDRARTEAYLAAIAKTVKRGDVVVDVGTGTGILAMAAARAGARRVWAIESGVMAITAEQAIAANGLAGTVEVVRSWSTRAVLAERADVLVSELIGDDPFGESVLPYVTDARDRLLKPGGRMVPRRLDVHAVPVTIPADNLRGLTFTPEVTRRWRSWYGFDFGTLPLSGNPRTLSLSGRDVRRCALLADGVRIARVDFATTPGIGVHSHTSCKVHTAGLVNGVLVSFDVDLAPGLSISTSPERVSLGNSWTTQVWLLSEPIQARAGQRLFLDYEHGGDGSWLFCRTSRR